MLERPENIVRPAFGAAAAPCTALSDCDHALTWAMEKPPAQPSCPNRFLTVNPTVEGTC
jgi:hypothetical protein